MSRLNRSARLLQNAEAAFISAIEIYNKPAFAYREETFAILAPNVQGLGRGMMRRTDPCWC
jgi:hypothetical protein